MLKKMPVALSGPIIRKKIVLNDDSVSDILFKIADTKDELEQAYKLVYDVYTQEKIIKSNRASFRLKLVNANPHTTVFIAKKEDQVIMTMSLYPDSILGLPIDKFFRKEVDLLRDKGRYIAEIGAFASAKDYRKHNQTLPFLMNKIMHTYASEYLNIDDMLITVHPKHVWVYKNLLLFKQIGKETIYCDKDIKKYPTVPLQLALETSKEKFKKTYNHYPLNKNLFHFFWQKNSTNISLPKEKKPYYIWTSKLFSYFFEEKTTVLNQVSDDLRTYILDLHNQQLRELKTIPA